MAAASYQHHQYHDHRPLTILNRDDDSFMRFKSQTIVKRKSAVELLQETKPLYVKSEIVLDRKQELRRSLRDYQLPNHEEEASLNGYCGIGIGNGVLNRLNNSTSPPLNNYVCPNYSSANGGTSVPFPLPKSPRLIPPPPAFRKSACSLQLQNKLRKLLNADSKENLLDTKCVAANSNRVSTVKTKNGCNDGLESSSSRFTSKHHTEPINNFNCHKSLPDLTNVRDVSSTNERSDEEGSCNCTPCSACPDKMCKKSSHFASLDLAFYKGDCLHTSIECNVNRNGRISENDELDNVCYTRENSLPTSPVKSCISYITPPPLYCDTSELLRNRPVCRSKSDVGGARNLSSLQSVDIPLYDSATLNIFFDNLGLNLDEYNSLTAPRSNASSPVYFSSSTSSIDSVGGRGSGNESLPLHPSVESPSIVERNARIIKWLCNCRKAFEQVPRLATPQSR